MAIIQNWLPPSRENWELVAWAWQFFPIFTAVQWLTDYYPQGKTSIDSAFNLPGKWAWAAMECPGFLTVLYCMFTIPQQVGVAKLPWGNWTMAGLYTLHYIYRALLSPLLLNPSMSPIHPTVALSAAAWQVINGISLGGWLAGYGPTTIQDWAGRLYWIEAGMVIFGWALLANIFHDDDLREIRRSVLRQQEAEMAKLPEKERKPLRGADKIYKMPKNGLFQLVLYPHYLCEWIEWAGFWMIGGLGCVPARSFLLNEISTMLPRALSGRRWYIKTFGKDKVGSRKAVIPGIL